MSLSHLIGTILIITIAAIIVTSCSASKKWKKQIDGPIVFGSYGGFVGSFDEYTINQDGTVFHQSKLKGDKVQIQKLSDEMRQEIFSRILTDTLYEESIDEPGNMTFFLKFTHKGENCDLKWGGQYDPSDALLLYHNYLSKHINANSPTM